MSALVAPESTVLKNQRSSRGTITPTFRVRPDARLDARDETTYPRLSAARFTRSRDADDTCPRPLNARDTVAVETPASFATSSMLTIARFPRREKPHSARDTAPRVVSRSEYGFSRGAPQARVNQAAHFRRNQAAAFGGRAVPAN